MNSRHIITKWWVLMVAGILATQAFAQAEKVEVSVQPRQAYIGFKSAEDKGQSLEAWFRLEPVLPGTTARITPGITMTSQLEGWSAAGRYGDGAFTWSADYARQQDIFSTGSGDRAWRLTGAYRVTDDVTVGALYGRLAYAPADTLSLDNHGWSLFGDWQIEAAHILRAGYVRANATFTAPVSLASVNARLAGGGADMWQLLYEYAFSQRTTLDVRYANSSSEAGTFYLNPGTAIPLDFGLGQRSLGVGVKHRF